MTQQEPDDGLKSMVVELNSAFCTALQICFDHGLVPMDGIENGSIPLSIELPEKWKTSPPSEEVQDLIVDTLEFFDFWADIMEQVEVYFQGGEPSGKFVPAEVQSWLQANGYGHLIDKLNEFWSDCLVQSVANQNRMQAQFSD